MALLLGWLGVFFESFVASAIAFLYAVLVDRFRVLLI